MTTSVENQNKFWMPTTPYTQTLNYGQRILINDTGREIPLAWRVSKVEDVQPIGITRLTFAQQLATLQEDCGKYGIAGWCTVADRVLPKPEACRTCPLKEPEYIDAGIEMPKPELPRGKIIYNGKDATLRVGGGAKTLTAMFWDADKQEYMSKQPLWKLSYMDNDKLLCSINLSFDGITWNVSPVKDCPSDIVISTKFNDDIATSSKVDGCAITCLSDNKEMFKIHVAPADDNFDALKLRCLQLYNMVGRIILVSAQDAEGQYTVDLKMEVVS
jgi:hypothetical protein